MLAFFRLRAVDGVEKVDNGIYRRTIHHAGTMGIVEIGAHPHRNRLWATVGLPSGEMPDGMPARLRRMFDLDADAPAIAAHLAGDPFMAALVAARPAIRVPGGFDGFETAARAVLGQQVSISAARRLNARLVERCGAELPSAFEPGLRRLFPTPAQVLAADLAAMGVPGARIAALRALAAAAVDDPHLFRARGTVEETVARFGAIRGLGEWTAHYIAMRACREADAFPASDVGLLRGAVDVNGLRPHPRDLRARAAAWRPWRAYAAHHLWAVDAARPAGDSR